MSQQPKQQDIVFNTGTGGLATARSYEGYTVYSFTEKADAELFLANNANAQKRNTKVKYVSVWNGDKYVNTKTETHVVLVLK